MDENRDLDTELEEKNLDDEAEGQAVEEETVQEEPVQEEPHTGIFDLTPDALDSIEGEYNPVQDRGMADDTLFTPLPDFFDQSKTIYESLEEIRAPFGKKLRFSSILNIASMIVMIVCFVAVLLVTILNPGIAWLTWTVLGISIALIVGIFIAASILNKKTSKLNQEYLGQYHIMIGNYLSEGLSIKNASFSAMAKLDDQDVIQAHYFKVINSIASRCVLQGKRNGRDIETGECLVIIPGRTYDDCNRIPRMIEPDGTTYIPENDTTNTTTQELPSNDMTMVDVELDDELKKGKEQRKKDEEKAVEENRKSAEYLNHNGFFGRIYSYKLRIDPEESFIICLRGDKKNTVLPDHVDNFKCVHISGLRKDFVVYLADPDESLKFFTPENIETLNDIRIDEHVLSLFISANSYGVKIGVNLSDSVMELPVKNPVVRGGFDSFIDTSKKCFAFVDSIEKMATVLSDEN